MNYNYIGKSGLRISAICMGTMTFGAQTDKKESFKILDKAYDGGVNFFDTAELYPVPPQKELAGITEEILGEWMKTKPRDSIILASKVAGAANGWFVPPIRHGFTAIDRFHIKKGVDGSLKRLGSDYIDLYQVHWPDFIVPVEEALEVFDELIKEGKIRYIGTSNDSAYGLTKANERAKFLGYKRFESIQNNFSLLNRRFLDELALVCKEEKISLLPYSPIAGGVLSGKYNQSFVDTEARYAQYKNDSTGRVRAQASKFVNPKTLASTARYVEIAKKYGINPVSMAVAWTLGFDFVPSTIIGARRVEQLEESLMGANLKLSSELLGELDLVHSDILYPMG